MLSTTLQHHRKQLAQLRRHPCVATPHFLLESHFQRLDDWRSDLNLCLKRRLQDKQLALLALKKQTLSLKPSAQIQAGKQKLSLIARSMQTSLFQQWTTRQQQFDREGLIQNLDTRLRDTIQQKKRQLEQLTAHLRGIDPKNLLTKGYCILFQEKKDSVILSSRELKEQDKVRLQLHDGKVHLTVNGMQS